MQVLPLKLTTNQEPTFWLRNSSRVDATPVMFPYYCEGKLPVYLEYSGANFELGVLLLEGAKSIDEASVAPYINSNRLWFCEIEPKDLQAGTDYTGDITDGRSS